MQDSYHPQKLQVLHGPGIICRPSSQLERPPIMAPTSRKTSCSKVFGVSRPQILRLRNPKTSVWRYVLWMFFAPPQTGPSRHHPGPSGSLGSRKQGALINPMTPTISHPVKRTHWTHALLAGERRSVRLDNRLHH